MDGSFEKLRQLILTEDFQQYFSHDLATHLSDKKLDRVDEAAVITDSYTLTLKEFSGNKKHLTKRNYNMKVTARSVTHPLSPHQAKFGLGPFSRQKMECFHSMPGKDSLITCAFCKRSGHIISNCFKLKRKQETEGSPYPNAFIKKYIKERVFARSKTPTKQEPKQNPLLENYKPFLSKGRVTIDAGCYKPIQILTHMGASQTLQLECVLPLSKATFTGNMVLL